MIGKLKLFCFTLLVCVVCTVIVMAYISFNYGSYTNGRQHHITGQYELSTGVPLHDEQNHTTQTMQTVAEHNNTRTAKPVLVDMPYMTRSTYGSARKREHTHQVLWYNPPPRVAESVREHVTSNCPYANCAFVTGTEKGLVLNSSAIIFSLAVAGMSGPPIQPQERDPQQVWVFHTPESQLTGIPRSHRHSDWRGSMNWSMTYRTDADIFFPYGALERRAVVPSNDYGALYRRKTGFVAWIVSHCGAQSRRDEYVYELQQLGISVDVYGKCGRRFDTEPRQLVEKYKFYLAFENTICTDYVTEKLFKYFTMDTVVVVRGGADYSKLFPSKAFINTADFDSVNDLAKFLVKVNSSEELYVNYLKERDKYTVYMQKATLYAQLCVLCEKLNHKNMYRKTYEDYRTYFKNAGCLNISEIVKKDTLKYERNKAIDFVS